jgi:hypothetical protein
MRKKIKVETTKEAIKAIRKLRKTGGNVILANAEYDGVALMKELDISPKVGLIGENYYKDK